MNKNTSDGRTSIRLRSLGLFAELLLQRVERLHKSKVGACLTRAGHQVLGTLLHFMKFDADLGDG